MNSEEYGLVNEEYGLIGEKYGIAFDRREFDRGVSFGAGLMTAIKDELSSETYLMGITSIIKQMKKQLDKDPVNQQREHLREKLNMSVDTLKFSVRLTRSFHYNEVTKIGQLVKMPRWKLAKWRNIGATSLDEVEDKLSQMGLSFDMTIAPDIFSTPDADPSI